MLIDEVQPKVKTRTILKPAQPILAQLLAEEDYTETLEHIIERDYFPHVAKLRAEAAYLDAMNDNDVDRMRTIAAEYARIRKMRQDLEKKEASMYAKMFGSDS